MTDVFTKTTGRLQAAWTKFWFSPKDLTALELIRVGAGFILFCSHFIVRLRLNEFYGSAGWLSLHAFETAPKDPWIQSIFFYVQNPALLSALNLLLLILSLCLALGFACSWIKWPLLFLHISFLYRNPSITYGADAVLTFILFTLCLAPIGLKSKRPLNRAESERGTACLRLLQIQMAVLFFYSGIEKLRGDSWWSGDAIWIVLTNYEFLKPALLDWLAGHYWIANLMTYGTLLFELTYPYLIWTRKTRAPYLLAAVLFHTGIALSMNLYLFSAAMIMGHLAFFDLKYWRRVFLRQKVHEETEQTFETFPVISENEVPAVHASAEQTGFFDNIRPFFAIDLRTLAAFRMALAVLILRDLWCRAQDLTAHYTDFGVLPRDVLFSKFAGPWLWSIHFASGLASFQIFLFLIAAILACLLFLGYRTRLASVLSWLFLISIQNRNYMVLQGGDIVFRMLAFWAMFLPLGAVWSIDQTLTRKNPERSYVCNTATAGFLLQMVFVFCFAALHKTDPVWRTEGSAVYYALMIDQFVTPFGSFLLHFPALLKALSFITYYLELIGPLFIFFPVATGLSRLLFTVVMIGLQIGFGLSLELGLFPWTMSTGWLIFLPGGVWDWLEQKKWFVELQKNVRDKIKRLSASRFFPKKNETPSLALPAAVQGLLLATLVYIFLWNVRTLDEKRFEKFLPQKISWIGYLFNIDQVWDMFSPRPLTGDGWFVIPGKLKDGTEVDLFRGQKEVRWEKPKRAALDYANQHWRKYMMNLWRAEHSGHRLYYGRYLCRNWNSKHEDGKQLDTFRIYFMQENTLLNGKTEDIQKILLWEHHCFDKTED